MATTKYEACRKPQSFSLLYFLLTSSGACTYESMHLVHVTANMALAWHRQWKHKALELAIVFLTCLLGFEAESMAGMWVPFSSVPFTDTLECFMKVVEIRILANK